MHGFLSAKLRVKVSQITNVIKKANKRLYFLTLLQRGKVPACDILSFYCTRTRPVLEYCAPVFHHALPVYLVEDIQRVQKRALSIILPECSYTDSLMSYNISTLKDRRQELCKKLFEAIVADKYHKLHHLLPPKHVPRYNLRKQRLFGRPAICTNRFMNTFMPAMSKD